MTTRFWLLLGIGLSSRFAMAEGESQNVLLADLGLHVVGFGYERTLQSHVGVQMDVEWYVPWTQNLHASPLVVWGFALRSRLFFYPFGTAPNGLWVSPVGTWGFGQATINAEHRWGPMWSVGGSVGYAFTLLRHLHASLGVGLQYNAGTFGRTAPPSYAGWAPIVDAAVGYAF